MKRLLSLLDLARLDAPGASDAVCVEQIALDLISELEIQAPPVNVEMVASLLDVERVVLDDRLDVAGCLLCGARGTEIRVRSKDASRRRRFTVAHECAHIFFPGYHLQTQYRCSPSRIPSKARGLENLCDLAASRLILPASIFRPDALATSFGLAAIEELASWYEASLTATAIRYVQVWPEPAAFLVFERKQKPVQYGTAAEPCLRLQWSATNGVWPHLPKHKSVDDGDVFDRALQGEIVTETPTTIRCLSRSPLEVLASACVAPYMNDGEPQARVLALLRRPGR